MRRILLSLCLLGCIVTYAQNPADCGTVTDYDGNTYTTIMIGEQCWMRENLRTTHYADGLKVPECTNPLKDTDPGYLNPFDSPELLAKNGILYNWRAATNDNSSSDNPSGVQGVCPNGWHIPSAAEWNQMDDYLRTQSQYYCDGNKKKTGKALAATSGWKKPSSKKICMVGNSQEENNATGFNAIPVGKGVFQWFGPSSVVSVGKCEYMANGNVAAFWTTTSMNMYAACAAWLFFDSESLWRPSKAQGDGKFNALSVRCVRN